MVWFRIAFRNIVKNRRRSLIATLTLLIGVAAINLFEGYMADTIEGLSLSAIHAEGLGHLIVFKRDALIKGKLDEEKYILTGDEITKIRRLLSKDPSVKLVVPKLEVSGLISNGKASVIFIGLGIDPKDDQTIRANYRYTGQGLPINAENPAGGQVAVNLAKILGLNLDDTVVIFSTTLAGTMNAVDLEVQGIYNTGSSATNDKYIKLPLQLARSLYDTDGAHNVSILLDSREKTNSAREVIKKTLIEAGLDVEVRTWEQMSVYYENVKNLFNMIYSFISLIVMLVVIMSVLNVMTMSVMERTREIGTLRALGLRRWGVLKVFCAEAFVLGAIGVFLGAILTVILIQGIAALGITYTPPGISERVSLAVSFLPWSILFNGGFLTLLCTLAGIAPARLGARMEIVNALGHV